MSDDDESFWKEFGRHLDDVTRGGKPEPLERPWHKVWLAVAGRKKKPRGRRVRNVAEAKIIEGQGRRWIIYPHKAEPDRFWAGEPEPPRSWLLTERR